MNRDLLLAVDIGTTNSKGALITKEGEMIASAFCRHQVSHPYPGWAEHDAENVWWKEFLSICTQLLETEGVSAQDIVSVGISTLTPAVLPVDKQFMPLRPAMLYGLDTRATKEIDDLNQGLGEQYIFDANMRPIEQKSPAPKILWLKNHEPEVFQKTAYFIGAPTYLVYQLTGRIVADYGCYKLAGLPFSLKSFGWDEGACKACGITVDQLPELKFATESAGTITKAAARATGLSEGTTVAVGTGDYLADSLSYGTQFLGMPKISYGSCVGVNNGNDPAAILFRGYQTDWALEAIPGGSMTNGCVTIDWMISLISGLGAPNRIDNAVLEKLANEVPAGANGITMLPYFNGEKVPFSDPQAKGLIFGLRMSHTQADLYKASLESIAYAIRHVLSLKTDGAAQEAFVVGGGTKIPMLLQTVSDVTGFRQTALKSYNGSLVGNAFIAGVAHGMFLERAEINQWVTTAEAIEPRKELKEVYDRGFQRFLDLYKVNADIMADSIA